MDYIFLIGIVLVTDSDVLIDNVDYKIKGFCLFDYRKQACKFVSIKGYKDWLDYFTSNILDIETYGSILESLKSFYSPDASVIYNVSYTRSWCNKGELLKSRVLHTLLIYDSKLKLIHQGYKHKCLGSFETREEFTIQLMLDVSTMKTFEILYYRGVSYYNVDDLDTSYRRFACPDIYFDSTMLTDIKYHSVDSQHTYYLIGERCFAFLTDIHTYFTNKEAKNLSIDLNLTVSMKSFDLIISDNLKDFSFTFEGSGFIEYLNFYIPKGFYCDNLAYFAHCEVYDMRQLWFCMDNDMREYVSKLENLYSSRKFSDLIALRVANNTLHQRLYLKGDIAFGLKHNFIYY